MSSIWFQDIIDFLYKHNISIFTKDFLTIKSQRKNDKCIMKEILQLNLSKTSLIQINSCIIYLQVFHLSDMLNPNSKQVTQDFIKGIKPVKQTSSYRWPNQLKPSTNAWKLWKKIITSTFKLTFNYNLPINLQLSNWIVPLDERQMQHKWYFSQESNEIYIHNQQRIQKKFIQSMNNNKYEIYEDFKERCDKIPNDAIPITHLTN